MKHCNIFLNKHSLIPINTVILTLNLYMYNYYLNYTVNVMVVKINNVSIDAFLSYSESTYEDT